MKLGWYLGLKVAVVEVWWVVIAPRAAACR